MGEMDEETGEFFSENMELNTGIKRTPILRIQVKQSLLSYAIQYPQWCKIMYQCSKGAEGEK